MRFLSFFCSQGCLSVSAIVFCVSQVFAQKTSPNLVPQPPVAPVSLQNFSKTSPDLFIENKGQWDAEARFLARLRGMNVWITDDGLVYDTYRKDEVGNMRDEKVNDETGTHRGSIGGKAASSLSPLISSPSSPLSSPRGHVVKMKFAGASHNARTTGVSKQAPYFNYFLGNDRTKWASNVPSFAEVRIQEVYDGISARVYFDSGQVRYDMIVAPGADASRIALEFEGADGVRVNENGDLVLQTSVGELLHGKLYAYQVKNGRRVQISCRFQALSGQPAEAADSPQGVVSEQSAPAVRPSSARAVGLTQETFNFALGSYDPALPLVIDPLVWGTYLGGGSNDNIAQIAFDPAGNIAATGIAGSATFPVSSSGVYDFSFNGAGDIFVAKFSRDGRSLLFSTYIGGSANDTPAALCVDASGNLNVGGYTLSSNFPTANAFDASYNGLNDMIIVRLNSSGSSLLYGTFLGTSGDDEVNGMVVDAAGILYVGGTSDGGSFPTTPTANPPIAYQTLAGGNNDIILAKIDPTLGVNSLLYSTYVGGSNSEVCGGVGTDATGAIFFWGEATGAGLVCTANAYDGTYNNLDAIVGKLAPSGNGTADMLYLSYFGGTGLERYVRGTVDQSGTIYITGATHGGLPIITATAFQSQFTVLNISFIARIDPSRSNAASLRYCSYFDVIVPTNPGIAQIIADNNGVVYFCGIRSGSSSFLSTPGAIQTVPGSTGLNDAFLTVLDTKVQGSGALLYSTLLGGPASDNAKGLLLDAARNNVYLCGSANGAFPVINGYDLSYNGASDGFLTNIQPTPEFPLRTGFGSAIGFNGSTNLIETQTAFDTPAQWTVECWVKSPAPPGGSKWSYPLLQGLNQAVALVWDHADPAFQGAAQILLSDGVTYIPAKFGMLQANTWYHLAASFDGRTLRAYQNGVQTSAQTAPAGLGVQPGSTTLLMGFGYSGNQFEGTMDEVRYWNTALPATTISRFAGQEISDTHPNWNNLLGYWKFNEYTGLITPDATRNRYDAQLTNAYGDAVVSAAQDYTLFVSPRSASVLAPRILPSIGQLSSTFPVNVLPTGTNGGSVLATVAVEGQTFRYTPRSPAFAGAGATDRVSYRLAQERDTVSSSLRVRFFPELSATTIYTSPNTQVPLNSGAVQIFGGTAPFSYRWEILSSGATLSSTTAIVPIATVSTDATFRLTVTDALNFTAATVVVVNTSGPFYYMFGDAAQTSSWSTDSVRSAIQPPSMNVPARFIVGANKIAVLNSSWTMNSRATLTIRRTGTLNISSSRVLENAGAVIVEDGGRVLITDAGRITGNSIILQGASILEYNGTTSKTSTDAEFPPSVSSGTIIIRNTGGIVLNGSKTVNTAFSLVDGGVVGVSNATLRLQGTLNLAGTFATDSLANIIFDGSGTVIGTFQTRSGVLGGLNLNRPSLRLALTLPLRLTNTLALNAGLLLSSGTSPLTLGDRLTLAGGNNSSFVQGVVRRTASPTLSTSSTLVFPVGIGSSYLPVSLIAPRVEGGNVNVEAEVVSAVAQTLNAGRADSSVKALLLFPAWRLGASGGRVRSSGLAVGSPVNIPDGAAFVRLTGDGGAWTALRSTDGASPRITSGTTNSLTLGSINETAFGTLSFGVHAPPPPPPVAITGFLPSAGDVATMLTIQGLSFLAVRSVLVGGFPVESFIVQSTTSIVAVLGAQARTGAITVVTATTGTAHTPEAAPFLVSAPPVVTNATPSVIARSQSFTLEGYNFCSRLRLTTTGSIELPPRVFIGTVEATSVRLLSPTRLTAQFTTLTRGTLSVETRFGSGFGIGNGADTVAVADAPVITSIIPLQIGTGGTVEVRGQWFDGVSEVRMGVRVLAFERLSANRVLLRIPANATPAESGFLRLTTPVGTAVFPRALQIIAPPRLMQPTPQITAIGDVIDLTGQNLDLAQNVWFQGMAAGSTVATLAQAYFQANEAGTRVRVLIPADIVVGTASALVLQSIGGMATTLPFITPRAVTQPTITGFSERAVLEGRQILVWGTNLPMQTTAMPPNTSIRLAFGGTLATTATVLSSTRITCTVPFGTVAETLRRTEATCTLEVRNDGASNGGASGGESVTTFSRLPLTVQANNLPALFDFTPRSGGAATELVLRGQFLGRVPRGRVVNVRVGGVAVASFLVSSEERIVARVGAISTVPLDGEVVVETASGLVSTTGTFRFDPAAPPPYIPVSSADSLALVKLYRAFGGDSWATATTNTWLRREVADWVGVRVADGRIAGLSLPNNNLAGSASILDVANIFADLNGLRSLNLANNFLTGDLPRSLATMPLLQELNLSNNLITGNLTALATAASLRILDLRNNALQDSLSTLCNAQTLEIVRLSGNRLTGALAPCVFALPNLTTLEASNNAISGILPTTLATVRNDGIFNLEVLHLANNRLSGTLPAAWGAETLVQRTLAGKTTLTAAQTHAFMGLQSLDLSNNQLRGELPASWGSFAALRFLNVAGNQLQGAVPAEWTNLGRLRNLNLRANAFTALPDFTRIFRLDTLDLRENQFHFDDIEAQLPLTMLRAAALRYAPQNPLGAVRSRTATLDVPFVERLSVRGAERYEWQKGRSDAAETSFVNIGAASTTGTLTLQAFAPSDTGSYRCVLTSSRVPGLRLETAPLLVTTTILPPVPTQTTLLAPASNAEDVALRPALMWSMLETARLYDVEISTQANFSTRAAQATVEQSENTLLSQDRMNTAFSTTAVFSMNPAALSAALPPLTPLFWRVRGRNVAGSGVWSSTGTFSTVNADVFVATDRLEFGSVARFDTARAVLVLRNIGDRPLRADGVRLSNPRFRVEGFVSGRTATDPVRDMPLSAPPLLAPGEQAFMRLAFMPELLGQERSDADVFYTLGTLSRTTRFPSRVGGRSVALKILPPDETDTVIVGLPRLGTALLVNRGREVLTIATVSVEASNSAPSGNYLGAGEWSIANSPAQAATLVPGDTLAVVLVCRATRAGVLPPVRFRVVVENAATGRGDTMSVPLQAIARPREITDVAAQIGIRAVPDSVPPGGNVVVEIFLADGDRAALRRSMLPGIRATLAINPNVLVPDASERGLVRVSGNNSNSLSNANTANAANSMARYALREAAWDGIGEVIASLKCRAVAGATDRTALVLERFDWVGVEVTGFRNGVFTARACEAGGKRLVTTAWATAIATLTPNPAKDALSVAYTLREDTHVELTLLDALGNAAQTLVSEEQQAGEHEINVALKHLPSGSYTLRLTTAAGATVVKKVQVVK